MLISNAGLWGDESDTSCRHLTSLLLSEDVGESPPLEVATAGVAGESADPVGKISVLEDAVAKMDAQARALRPRPECPAYHLTLSIAGAEETFGHEDHFRVLDEYMKAVGLLSQPRVYIVHEEHFPHVHAVVGRAREDGLWTRERLDTSHVDLLLRIAQRLDPPLSSGRPYRSRIKSWKMFRWKHRDQAPYGVLVKRRCSKDFKRARTWAELQARLARSAVYVEKRSKGGVVTNGNGERWAPLSEVRRMWSFPRLDNWFPYSFKQVPKKYLPDPEVPLLETDVDRSYESTP